MHYVLKFDLLESFTKMVVAGRGHEVVWVADRGVVAGWHRGHVPPQYFGGT